MKYLNNDFWLYNNMHVSWQHAVHGHEFISYIHLTTAVCPNAIGEGSTIHSSRHCSGTDWSGNALSLRVGHQKM